MPILTKFLHDHPEYARKLSWQVFLRDQKCKICNLQIQQVELNVVGDQTYYAPCAYLLGETIWFNVDHIVPRSISGKSNLSNLRTTCEPCNQYKGADAATISEGLSVPSDYEYQVLNKSVKKKIDTYYPDWKPYYGF